jgi:hypothetical protein
MRFLAQESGLEKRTGMSDEPGGARHQRVVFWSGSLPTGLKNLPIRRQATLPCGESKSGRAETPVYNVGNEGHAMDRDTSSLLYLYRLDSPWSYFVER